MNKRDMRHLFSMIPKSEIQRSVFDRSHSYKTTFNAGYLVPFLVDEVLPGDSFKVSISFLARLATPIAPIMDNMFLDTFYFFVPNRLLWEHWKEFMGEQFFPGASTDFTVPVSKCTDALSAGTLEDYMGIPTGVKNIEYNELPIRAYNLIYNEWFRDENLQNPLRLNTSTDLLTIPSSPSEYGQGDNGANEPNFTATHRKGIGWGSSSDSTSYVGHPLMRRGKRHDYFTSCLPWPQKGESVGIGLTGDVPIKGALNAAAALNNPTFDWSSGSLAGYDAIYSHYDYLYHRDLSDTTSDIPDTYKLTSITGDFAMSNPSGLSVSLSDASAITINALRQAFQLQKMYEKDARGGTRYTEILRSHFGVVSPDARLQRPEYLGGSETRIVINPVVQQSSTDSTSPQGNLAAFGLAAASNHGFTKSFVEHGYIIGLVNVRADLSYQQGLNRMWSRQTREEFYWPTLAHLGEQAVLNKEIYTQGTDADNEVFGYQERYAEYRYFPNMITGEFRSTYAQTLDYWHLSQKFSSLPSLNSSFIVENPPVERVVSVTSEPQFIFDSYIKMKCARPMPVYGVPGLVDHF